MELINKKIHNLKVRVVFGIHDSDMCL
jgi:hypothetical protein